MRVQMRGELIRKCLVDHGISTLKQAANQARCDVRTLQRAMRGEPVRLDTAITIYKAFKLDPEEVIIHEPSTKKLYDHGEEQDTEESSAQVVDAIMAAGEAIHNTFKSHQSSPTVLDLITILSAIIATYSLEIARESHATALFFVEDIAHKAQTQLHSELSKSDNTTALE